MLCPPYAQWSAHGLLRYFQTRQHVHYFALRDEEQASQSKVNAILENRFEYNDEAYYLVPGFDWTANPSADVEWLILLHKFYFAVGLGEDYVNTGDPRLAQKWVELTEAWIDNVPLDFLSSDVTGRRVQNWIFAHHYFVNSDYVLNLPAGAKQPTTPGLTPVFHQKFLRSLHQQVDFLCHNLTPARNHRTIELYAIFMAAVVFPEFADAADWLDFVKAELVQNIQADLRADGVHCEQSIDYHHLVVKNYLGVKRLATANGIEVPQGTTFYKGLGCSNCLGSGFAGRMPIFEVMTVTPELAIAIEAKMPAGKLREIAVKQGMQELRGSGFDAVLAGRTTLEEVYFKTSS